MERATYPCLWRVGGKRGDFPGGDICGTICAASFVASCLLVADEKSSLHTGHSCAQLSPASAAPGAPGTLGARGAAGGEGLCTIPRALPSTEIWRRTNNSPAAPSHSLVLRTTQNLWLHPFSIFNHCCWFYLFTFEIFYDNYEVIGVLIKIIWLLIKTYPHLHWRLSSSVLYIFITLQ